MDLLADVIAGFPTSIQPQRQPSTAQPLDSPSCGVLQSDVIEWAREVGLVKLLFAGNTHEEFILRAKPFLSLLARTNTLDGPCLDLIWDALQSKDVSISTAVYETLRTLGDLRLPAVQHLLTKISDAPPTAFDVRTVRLAQQLSSHVGHAPAAVLQCKTLLWRLLRDGATRPRAQREVVDVAIEHLTDLYLANGDWSERVALFQTLLSNIEKGDTVIPSIYLLLYILRSYRKTPYPGHTHATDHYCRAYLIHGLRREGCLPEVLLRDLAAFCAAPRPRDEYEDEDGHKTCKTGIAWEAVAHSYGYRLHMRLRLLRAVLKVIRRIALNPCTSGDVDGLSDTHAAVLCDCLLRADSAVAHKSYTCRWLMRLVAGHYVEGKVEVLQYSHIELFFQYLCKLEVSTMKLRQFQCLYLFLLRVNEQDGYLHRAGRTTFTNDGFDIPCVVDRWKPVGFDVLWDCLVHSPQPVFPEALNAVVRLYTKATGSAALAVRQEAVSNCCSFLVSAKLEFDEADSPDEQQQLGTVITRLVTLLKALLCFVDVPSVPDADPLLLPAPKTEQDIEKEKQLAECFPQISTKTRRYALRTRPTTDECYNDLTDYPLLLEKEANPYRMEEDQKDEPRPCELTFVQVFCSDDNNLEVVLNLLDDGSTAAARVDADLVWALLSVSGVNSRLVGTMSSGCVRSWAEILGAPPSGHRLLFALQCTDACLDAKLHDPQWLAYFVSSEGLAFLPTLFRRCCATIAEGEPTRQLLSATGLLLTIFTRLLAACNGPVLHSLPLPTVAADLLELIAMLAPVESASSTVAAACSTLECVVALEPAAAHVLRQTSGFGDTLARWLGAAGDDTSATPATRLLIAAFVKKLCVAASPPAKQHSGDSFHSWLLASLLSHLFGNFGVDPTPYYDVLSHLLREQAPGTAATVTQRIIDHLRKYRPIEDFFGSEDHVLIGYLRILNVLLGTDAKLAAFLAHELVPLLLSCIFEVNPMGCDRIVAVNKLTCKSTASRKATFALLETLCDAEPTCRQQLISSLAAIHELCGGSADATVVARPRNCTSGDGRGYVGLKNNGCTCYVNAVLQQLYMIPLVRNSILRASANKDADPLLFGLQRVFAHLQESCCQYYDPVQFCETYSRSDCKNEAHNIHSQQDADEFFTSLLAQLEKSLFGTPEENLLNMAFTGVMVQQLSCPANHTSVQESPFVTISLDVQQSSTLQEALRLYMQGEQISEFSCDVCKGVSSTATKRFFVKATADLVVIHLKRYTLDLSTMTRTKLHCPFSFPLALDMRRYMCDGDNAADDENDMFDLVGVVVHTGSADSGHYFSLIKERSCSGRWLIFDDTFVAEHSPFVVPCSVVHTDSQADTASTLRNAYLLFYERTTSSARGLVTVTPPLPLFKEVAENNIRVFETNCHCSEDYNGFVLRLVSRLARMPCAAYVPPQSIDRLSPRLRAVSFATRFALEVVVTAPKRPNLQQWVDLLASIYKDDTEACEWFLLWTLERCATALRSLLLENEEQQTREGFSRLVMVALTVLHPLECVVNHAAGRPFVTDSVVALFVSELLSRLELTREHWRRSTQYFALLKGICDLGPEERHYLIISKSVGKLIDFYLGNDSPVCKGDRVRMADGGDDATFANVLSAVADVTAVLLSSARVDQSACVDGVDFVPLPDYCQGLLKCPLFWRQLALRDGPFGRVAWRVCFGSEWFSSLAVTETVGAFADVPFELVFNVFAAIEALATLPDSLQEWRVQLMLDRLLRVVQVRWTPDFGPTCTEFLLGLSDKCAVFSEQLRVLKPHWHPWISTGLRHIAQVNMADQAALRALQHKIDDFGGHVPTPEPDDFEESSDGSEVGG
eukprot:TRINITY_DN1786_c0_g1_i2.p1 TRINITY_DN1786_c0_g1~~TRINITY_DN1786_c0_g1_i2.p1  ORF type:complete len:2116 (+),score=478.17 TRINITY_DN1786_c0_g1_i2:829-6348(+)